MENKKRSISTKTFAILLAVVLIIGCMAGGTIAWLIDSKTVTNTFTYGDININLTETPNREYKIIPGVTIPKDPTVTVEAPSEACWLFVEVTESDAFKNAKVDYTVINEWKEVPNVDNVYYREVPATSVDTSFGILNGNVVTVKDTLTKSEVATLKEQSTTLTFTAYAVQKEGINDVATAWTKAKATA